MIRILLFLYLVQFGLVGYAQKKKFILNGEVIGEQKFKNAFLFDNNYNQIGKRRIIEGFFSFTGEYFSEQPDEFGEIGLGTLLLSNLDTVLNEESLFPSKPFVRMLIMEPNINVPYISSKNKFLVTGGKLNEVQNLFYENDYLYKNKTDSAFTSIDVKLKNDVLNKQEKKKIKRQLFSEQKALEFYLIEKNKDSRVAMFNFNDFTSIPIVPIEKCFTLYHSFPDSLKKSKYGSHTLSLMEDLAEQMKPSLKTANRMPFFTLVNTENKVLNSKDLLNKYTLIDFWASWCNPCRAEAPNLKLAYQKYHKKGFNIISISIDAEKDKLKWLTAIKVDKIEDFINLFNPGAASGIGKELNINAIPANYLIDSKGNVVGLNLRGSDLENRLAQLFKE
ncbi:hypothetical protein DHW03_17155 [Pedobacter yonginense]|uniref:Thioredoxin domain-containing protein n=1 Tax=Pedobacter yonginense TaxID=651869 RepID=A0A317EMJ9_9SPHI|nr:thioredoxin-like domain-containing protein [Pedobacter yonginense]PWS26506.1 hypothetical protein DHW03_17155 [Pedobacter yonginense]